MAQIEAESKVLKVTEFITVGEVANMMRMQNPCEAKALLAWVR